MPTEQHHIIILSLLYNQYKKKTATMVSWHRFRFMLLFFLHLRCCRIQSLSVTSISEKAWKAFNNPRKLIPSTSKQKGRTTTTTTTNFTNDNHPNAVAMASLDRKLFSISFYSFLHQASMPFAELVDSVHLSNMDPTALGAMGVAKSSQNSVSKIYNSPLSKTTISLVASASGSKSESETKETEDEALSTTVSAALIFALLIGTVQLLCFTLGGNTILNASGLDPSNGMHSSALAYMHTRALAAPLFTLWTVLNSIFRGLGDAKSPLIGAIIFNLTTMVSDHIFLHMFKMGIVGAAVAGTIAQAATVIPLLWILNRSVSIRLKVPLSSFAKYLSTYGTAGVYLLGRSIARTASYSYSSRRAALLGPVAASTYSIMYQIGLWISMVCEGLAIANQSLLSQAFSGPTDTITPTVRHLVKRSCQVGMFTSVLLSFLVYIFWDKVISVFTSSVEIQQAATGALPIFLCAQVIKGISFPMNGIAMGGMDWSAAMWSMCASNVACFLTLRWRVENVKILWFGWIASYAAQGILLVLRYKSRTGVWSRISKSE